MSDDYQNAVLTDLPLAYWRLDEVGPATNGDTITDLSGNDHHATLCFADPSFTPYGQPSAIETDGDSRALYTFSDNLSHVGGRRCYAYNSDSALNLSNDFTVECWVKSNSDVVSASSFAFFGKRGRFMLTRTFNASASPANFHFTLRVSLSDSNTYIVVAEVPINNNEWYYLVGGRLENAIYLRVNTTLAAITTTPALPQASPSSSPLVLTPCTPPGNLLQIGGLPFNDVHNDCILDECAIYDYSLSEARVIAHYEAALNVLNMRGQCDVRTSAVLSGMDEGDPAEYSFRHNWVQPVVERFRWRTGVFRPVDGPVELTRQRSSLRRQVEYQHLLYSERLRRQFEARAFGGRTTLVQFEPDKVRVGDLSSSATSASFDTRYRDFEVGQRVLIYQDDDTYEFQTLTDVSDEGIEWSEGLSRDYLRPWIKPARVARLPREQSVEMQNDVIGDSSTIYEYQSEDEPFTPRRIIQFSPTLFHYGREVFDLSQWQGHDYSELPTIEYMSDRSELDDGVGVVSSKQYQSGADTTQPYNMNLHGRELIARYLGWLYYRAGQYEPFWMPTFKQDLHPLARSGNVLLVEGHEYSDYYSSAGNRGDLAFIYFDGSVVLRRIESFVSEDANDSLSLDSTTPTFTGLRWLSFLRRVVLSSDDVEIAWQTDETVRVAFAVVDAPMDIEVGSPSVSPSPSASTSTSTSPSASSSRSQSPSSSLSPSASISPTISPSSSPSQSSSSSISPSASASPST